jgi:hypothetical protein
VVGVEEAVEENDALHGRGPAIWQRLSRVFMPAAIRDPAKRSHTVLGRPLGKLRR